jgi:environmental stress-induced protein Ves
MSIAPTITLLPASGYRAMPWRNGLGTTTEIAVEPGAAEGRFRWRLSIADVAQSGPFSIFDGYDRVIAVAAGAGMRLAVAGRPTALLDQSAAPYDFPGDADTGCSLIDGPIRDFNLITDRATVLGRVVAMQAQSVVLDGETALLHALRGAFEVDAAAHGQWAVPEGDTLRLDGVAGEIRIGGPADGRALLATILAR